MAFCRFEPHPVQVAGPLYIEPNLVGVADRWCAFDWLRGSQFRRGAEPRSGVGQLRPAFATAVEQLVEICFRRQ